MGERDAGRSRWGNTSVGRTVERDPKQPPEVGRKNIPKGKQKVNRKILQKGNSRHPLKTEKMTGGRTSSPKNRSTRFQEVPRKDWCHQEQLE